MPPGSKRVDAMSRKLSPSEFLAELQGQPAKSAHFAPADVGLVTDLALDFSDLPAPTTIMPPDSPPPGPPPATPANHGGPDQETIDRLRAIQPAVAAGTPSAEAVKSAPRLSALFPRVNSLLGTPQTSAG